MDALESMETVDTLKDVLKDLENAEARLKAQVERLFGAIETTDFADEYQALCDVHDKLQAIIQKS